MAHFLHVNRRAAFVGGLITNTWISVLTFVFAAKIGAKVTGQKWQEIYRQCKELLTHFSWREFFDAANLEILKPLFVGYAILGFVMAVVTYFTVRVYLTNQRQKKDKKFDSNKENP